jgi:hypothetical protein
MKFSLHATHNKTANTNKILSFHGDWKQRNPIGQGSATCVTICGAYNIFKHPITLFRN